MKTILRHSLPLLTVCTTMMLGINQASAYSFMTQQIEENCASLQYPLLSEYATNSCSACHNSSSAKSAFNNGNFEYFCPEPIAQGPVCTDADNDGYYVEGGDCGTPADFNDNNANVYPGATEDCTDGIDNNGNGLVDADDPNAEGCPINCTDADFDGYFAEGEICGTLTDFNDSNAAAFPGAAEDCTDGIDNDGNGLADAADPNAAGCPLNCTDLDGDTYSIDGGECGPMDCDDDDPEVNPGAEEICTDSIDNNCNGRTDTADMNAVNCPIACTDVDGDGYSIDGGACGAMDCDDTNDTVNPAALEVCDDGIDNNCNNLSDAADNVCQTNDGDTDQNTNCWWRKGSEDRDQDDDNPWKRREHHDDDNDDDDDEASSRGDRDDDNRWSRRSYKKRISSWRSKERDDD